MKRISTFLLFAWLMFDVSMLAFGLGVMQRAKEAANEMMDKTSMMHIETIYINEVPYELAIELKED